MIPQQLNGNMQKSYSPTLLTKTKDLSADKGSTVTSCFSHLDYIFSALKTPLIHHTQKKTLSCVFDLCLSMNYSMSYSLS